MGIENIPEMQVMKKNPYEGEIDFVSQEPISYSSRFTIIEGPEGRKYVFSVDKAISHTTLVNMFATLSFRKHEVRGFDGLSGGFLSIDGETIKFHGESEKFGKYDEQIVRPIAERWRQQNLPNHELVFE